LIGRDAGGGVALVGVLRDLERIRDGQWRFARR
jgi:hypothetical protein